MSTPHDAFKQAIENVARPYREAMAQRRLDGQKADERLRELTRCINLGPDDETPEEHHARYESDLADHDVRQYRMILRVLDDVLNEYESTLDSLDSAML